LVDALKLYSDMRFLDKAKNLASKIKTMPDGSPERVAMQAQYDAYVKNISTPELQPEKK
jgi:hypothetical protein